MDYSNVGKLSLDNHEFLCECSLYFPFLKVLKMSSRFYCVTYCGCMNLKKRQFPYKMKFDLVKINIFIIERKRRSKATQLI